MLLDREELLVALGVQFLLEEMFPGDGQQMAQRDARRSDGGGIER